VHVHSNTLHVLAILNITILRRYVVRRYNVVHVVRIEIIIFLTVHVVRKYGSTFIVPSYGSTEVLSYFRTKVRKYFGRTTYTYGSIWPYLRSTSGSSKVRKYLRRYNVVRAVVYVVLPKALPYFLWLERFTDVHVLYSTRTLRANDKQHIISVHVRVHVRVRVHVV
jgi:hypothetical protein